MSAEYTYDYAIVRVVPRVERGERINAGVILSCADLRFLDARIELDAAAVVQTPKRPRLTRRLGGSTAQPLFIGRGRAAHLKRSRPRAASDCWRTAWSS